MDKSGFEKNIYEFTVQSIIAARGLLDEPRQYAVLRVMDMISSIIAILDEHNLGSKRLTQIKQRIDNASEDSMKRDDELRRYLDETILESLDDID